MDSERYQRVQDLFWEAEEIEPNQWQAFLADRCGDDTALINEVVSLLREHDPDAALAEGNEVRPISSPSSDSLALADDTGNWDPTVVDEVPNTASRGSNQLSDLTLKASQRTHAAPREGITGGRRPKSPTPSKRREIPRSVLSAERDQARWNWVWVLLCLWIAATTLIWTAAWYVGRTAMNADVEITRQLLPAALDRTKFELMFLLSGERELCEKLANGQVADFLTSFQGQASRVNEDVQADKVNENARKLISQLPYVQKDSFETAIWDRDFRSVIASSGLTETGAPGVVAKDRTMQLASMLRSCLAGNTLFWNGAPESDRGFDPENGRDFGSNQFGWMVPVYEDASKPESPIGAVLFVREQSWYQTQVNLDLIAEMNHVDVYLIDRQGIMRSESDRARQFIGFSPYRQSDAASWEQKRSPKQIAGRFRVAEYQGIAPEMNLRSADTDGIVPPLTYPADGIAQLQDEAAAVGQFQRMTPYPNYEGVMCRGAWCWVPEFRLGIVIERALGKPPVFSSTNPLAVIANPLSNSWLTAFICSLIAIPMISLLTIWQQRTLRQGERRNRPLSRYSIQDELGSGGMGLVFRAKHLELGRDIAIKFLRDDCQDDDDQHRFDREARLAAMLSCPHSVTIFDYGRTVEGDAFCVMELLDGITLYEVVARSGPQSPGRVIWIIQQVCQSMLEAHASGLMHRDLKPQNIMLRFDPAVGDYAVVFDFGLAKSIEPDQGMFQTAETIWAGTPMYMAPERFREPSVLDPRSDLYSIGCIAYYLLSGCPPFAECNPESMFGIIMTQLPVQIEVHRNEPIDPRLAQWVSYCMAKDKRQRPASVAEMIQTLQPISEQLSWTLADAKQWWDAHGETPSL